MIAWCANQPGPRKTQPWPYVHQDCETYMYKQRSILHVYHEKEALVSERVRRPGLSDDIVLSVQAILEGRQQLPSDYWKEFARGPYFIIAGEGAHDVLRCFHVSLGCYY